MREMSGTRRGMSSKPASYAFSYGIVTISELLPVIFLTLAASSPIVISSPLPMLKTCPMARGSSIKATIALTTSPT